MVTGRFAHMRMSGGTMVSTASAEEANISVLLLWVSAWHIAEQPDVAQRAPRHAADDRAGVSSTLIEPSIGRAP